MGRDTGAGYPSVMQPHRSQRVPVAPRMGVSLVLLLVVRLKDQPASSEQAVPSGLEGVSKGV